MEICHASGCNNEVSKPGHRLCYKCWKKQQLSEKVSSNSKTILSTVKKTIAIATPILNTLISSSNNRTTPINNELITATHLGENFGLEGGRVNMILSELGWIIRAAKGWRASSYAKQRLGAIERIHPKSGIPYVLWKREILNNPILRYEMDNFTGRNIDETTETSSKPKTHNTVSDFRTKFEATFRSTDGHMTRSKAEMLIDNWLYMSGIVHAYERKLPIEEEIYCDFYLPQGKVYIEYWGLENDPAYRARKEEKKRIYAKYNLGLIDLTDNEVKNLDDHLPRFLLRFNVAVD